MSCCQLSSSCDLGEIELLGQEEERQAKEEEGRALWESRKTHGEVMKEMQGSIITKRVEHSIRVKEGQIVTALEQICVLQNLKAEIKIKFRKKEKLLYMEGVT